jgi:hypothetical protein
MDTKNKNRPLKESGFNGFIKFLKKLQYHGFTDVDAV